jgi:hypothetical protein
MTRDLHQIRACWNERAYVQVSMFGRHSMQAPPLAQARSGAPMNDPCGTGSPAWLALALRGP